MQRIKQDMGNSKESKNNYLYKKRNRNKSAHRSFFKADFYGDEAIQMRQDNSFA